MKTIKENSVAPKPAKLRAVEPIATDVDPWKFWLSIRRCQNEAEAEAMIINRDAALTLAAMQVASEARDAAVTLLKAARDEMCGCEPCTNIKAALVCLEEIK